MGSVLAPDEWDVPLDYAALRAAGIRLGHGGVVAIPARGDLRDVLLNWTEFMAAESCGKCVPCAQGSRAAHEMALRMRTGSKADATLVGELVRLMNGVEAASLCGFGQGIAEPIRALANLALRLQGLPGARN
jgi:NADH:ubiquinone oxidoreductase subunit F (NADH-binding)